MNADLYKKSPEAEALLKGIPTSLFRYASVSFIVVLTIVLGIGKWITFPVQKSWESYFTLSNIQPGFYELILDSTVHVSSTEQPQITILVHKSGREPMKLSGNLIKEVEGGYLFSPLDSLKWKKETGEGFSTIILIEGEISLWKKLVSTGS